MIQISRYKTEPDAGNAYWMVRFYRQVYTKDKGGAQPVERKILVDSKTEAHDLITIKDTPKKSVQGLLFEHLVFITLVFLNMRANYL